MKKVLFLLLIVLLSGCKKKANSGIFTLGFLGVISQEPPVEVTIGGTVTGLKGQGLVLQNNGTDDLPITSDGTFQFPKVILEGTSYNVTVKTQPTSPSQTCVVAGGIGQVLKEPITTVTVNCSTNKYTIGGTVSGLASTGLSLQLDSTSINIASNGTFAFPITLESGTPYNVTMSPANGQIGGVNQPAQTCTLSNGGGIVQDSAISNITVQCVTQTVQLTINANYLPSGATLVVQNNSGANINLTYAQPSQVLNIPSGSPYNVTIKTQPGPPAPAICTNPAGSGVAFANSTVNINCTAASSIVVTTSGLAGSSGVLLQNNGGDNLQIGSNGNSAFSQPLTAGSSYNVTVAAQPTNPWQTCTVTGGSGTVAAGPPPTTSVTLNCITNTYKVGATIIGLAPNNSITLELDGADNNIRTGVNANGNFLFPTAKTSGNTSSVSIMAGSTLNNPNQTCRMTYNGNTVTVTHANSSPVNVYVPILGSDVTDITVNCSNLHTVSGIITGLDANSSGLVLALNSTILTSVSGGDTSFTFPAPEGLLAVGDSYSVTVYSQPTPNAGGKWQECNVSLGSGTISGDVTNVVVACTTATYTIGGTIVGLSGTGLTIQHISDDNTPTINETMDITSGSTTFTFPTPQQSGTTYSIQITAQPIGQVCRVLNPTGTVVGGSKTPILDASGNPIGTFINPNITSIVINCLPGYMISGTITNYTGNGLRLQNVLTGGNPNTEEININSNGTFAFPTLATTGQNYAVTVTQQPWGPTQVCTVTNGTGSVASSDITNITINCVTQSYSLIVTVQNWVSGLVIKEKGTDTTTITPTSNGNVTLIPSLLSGSTYEVVVQTHPTGRFCHVFNGSGRIWGSNTERIFVDCNPSYETVIYSEWSVRGHYRMNDGPTSFIDLIPTAANGTASSGVVKNNTAGLLSGDANQSVFLNGTGYIEMGNLTTNAKYNFTGSFTLEAWIVPYSLNGRIIGKGNSYNLSLVNGKVRLCVGANCIDSITSLVLGRPYFIAATYYQGNNGARIFINGIQDTVANTNVSPTTTTALLRVGADQDGNNNFTGIVDEVAIYGWNLGNQRILSHYRWGSKLHLNLNLEGNVTDTSSYGNDFSSGGAGSLVTSSNKSPNGNSAYSFNNTQNLYLTAGLTSPTTQSYLADKMTMMAWVRPTGLTGDQPIVYQGTASDGFGIGLSTNKAAILIGSNTHLSGPGYDLSVTPSRWYHIAAKKDGANWYLYVNGKEQNLGALSSLVTPGTYFSIGKRGTDFFNGDIAGVKVFHTALSQEEIQRYATNVSDSLVAYYPFFTNNDLSPIKNTHTTATNTSANDRYGFANLAGSFSTNEISLSNPFGLVNGNTARTICAYVRWTSFTAGTAQVILEYTGGPKLQVTENSGNYLAVGETGSVNVSLTLSNWHHFCTTYAGGTGGSFKIYWNSSLVSSTSLSPISSTVTSLKIGQSLSSTNPLNAQLDEVRIYNRELSADEIKALSDN